MAITIVNTSNPIRIPPPDILMALSSARHVELGCALESYRIQQGLPLLLHGLVLRSVHVYRTLTCQIGLDLTRGQRESRKEVIRYAPWPHHSTEMAAGGVERRIGGVPGFNSENRAVQVLLAEGPVARQYQHTTPLPCAGASRPYMMPKK